MSIVNQTVPRALKALGYTKTQVDDIVNYIDIEKTILGAPHLKEEHEPVFACSMGDNAIHYLGHVKMMAAVQPFLSGAISKTVNMPEEATVEDVEQIHIDSWKMGLKAVAIYRDNCKVAQPLSMAKKDGAKKDEPAAAAAPASTDAITDRFIVKGAVRRELPEVRTSKTYLLPRGRQPRLHDRRRIRRRHARRALHEPGQTGLHAGRLHGRLRYHLLATACSSAYR